MPIVDEIRDNQDLVVGAIVVYIARRNGMAWGPAIALGIAGGYWAKKAAAAKAKKALQSLPHGPEVRPTEEQRAKLKVVPAKKAPAK